MFAFLKLLGFLRGEGQMNPDADFFRINIHGAIDAPGWVVIADDYFEYQLGGSFRSFRIDPEKSKARVWPKQSAMQTAGVLRRLFPQVLLAPATYQEWIEFDDSECHASAARD